MKKILIIVFILIISILSWSQVPEGFNYQAVLHNTSGDLIAEQNVSVKINIISGSETGTSVYSETHNLQTSKNGLINLIIGSGDNITGTFTSIEWGNSDYFLKIELDENGGTSYTEIGVSQLLSVPYSLYTKNAESSETAITAIDATNSVNAEHAIIADTALVAKNLDKEVLYFTDSDTLFAVKDRDGNIVFAVFTDGVKVYVNKTVKGSVGGFAVSGRSPSKAVEEEYFVITADSARIYIAESGTKGSVGGFAVSGRSPSKAGYSEFFNISGTDTIGLEVIDPSEARMLWYPKSEAFLVGRVLIEDPDSIGLNSISTGYESKAIGDWSQALGYQSVSRGNYSTAIGKNAIADSINSFAFGNQAYAKHKDAFAIGSGAVALGEKSFAFGSTGVDTLGNITSNTIASGENSFALGLGAVASGLGAFSLGANAISADEFTVAMGYNAISNKKFSTAIGPNSLADGYYSTAIGYNATASGNASTSIGYRTTASGSGSFAGGQMSVASGFGAVALGMYCEATVGRSVAMGDACYASNTGSIAMGKSCDATGYAAVAMGQSSKASGSGSFALGRFASTNGKDGSFVFSDGIDKGRVSAKADGQVVFLGTGGMHFHTSKDTLESKTFVIKANSGNVGLGTFTPAYKLDVIGSINITGSYLVGAKGSFADFVFADDYKLESIEEHSDFMWNNKHLPALKSAKELKNGGSYDISERREQMLEELEKAHIYIEQLNIKIKTLESENSDLKNTQNEIVKKLEKLEELVKLGNN